MKFQKLLGGRKHKTGIMPGSLVHIGEKRSDDVTIDLISYDESNFQEKKIDTGESVFGSMNKNMICWVNVNGLHDIKLMEKIGQEFHIHLLVMEDVLNTSQRSKYEDFEDYLSIVFKMISYDNIQEEIRSEQVSLVLGKNYLITFQEKRGDVFEPVRDRIRNAKGKSRKMGADYLAYALLDAVVDNYYVVLEKIAEKIENLEQKVVESPSPKIFGELHNLKKGVLNLRRQLWPLREVAGSLARADSNLVKEDTEPFFRDLHDHIIQVTDSIDAFRDMISGLMDVYLSSISNRTNEIMKVLTIFAAIFIPLTFIVGIYGMNFEYMPELKWKFSYPILWGIMILLSGGMLIYFKKKKWL